MLDRPGHVTKAHKAGSERRKPLPSIPHIFSFIIYFAQHPSSSRLVFPSFLRIMPISQHPPTPHYLTSAQTVQ